MKIHCYFFRVWQRSDSLLGGGINIESLAHRELNVRISRPSRMLLIASAAAADRQDDRQNKYGDGQWPREAHDRRMGRCWSRFLVVRFPATAAAEAEALGAAPFYSGSCPARSLLAR